MKKKIIKTISITLGVVVLFLVLLAGYAVYEGGKTMKEIEVQDKQSKEIEIAKKEYMAKVNSVSLFGVKFFDYIFLHMKDYKENQNLINILKGDGRFKGKMFKDSDLHYPEEINNFFRVEIDPELKNENFVEYYASYSPFSSDIYSIVGVLPKKMKDFIPSSDVYYNKVEVQKSVNKCIDYLLPFVSLIDDGIQSKANFLVVNNFKYGQLFPKIQYKMNSGIKIVNKVDDKEFTYNFDNIDRDTFYSIEDPENYRTTIYELRGYCHHTNITTQDRNIYISLTQKLMENLVAKEEYSKWHKIDTQRKVIDKKIELENIKKSLDKTGLQ